MNTALKEYYRLIQEGDCLYQKTKEYFGSCILCKAGCSDCCVNIAVFPVEWYAITLWLEAHGFAFLDLPDAHHCVFLKNGGCGIYPIRPLICRVSGVPLMYLTEDDDYPDGQAPAHPEYQVTWCEYNFRDISGEASQKVMSDDTVIDMEALNVRLAEINYHFLKTKEGRTFNLRQRYTIGEMYRLWNNSMQV